VGTTSLVLVPGDVLAARFLVTLLDATADAVLTAEPDEVGVLGIDDTRRGKPKWATCPDTGERSWVDRFDTGLVDITGDQGLLTQVNGRTTKVVTAWLAARDEGWRAGIIHVTIDMSAGYAKAVREGLPTAVLVVDRFYAEVLVMPRSLVLLLVRAVNVSVRSA